MSQAVAATILAELAYVRPDGAVGMAVVPPLVAADGRIVVALPYAQRRLADELGVADQVALVLSDDRMALRGWEPLVITGRLQVTADTEGHRFEEEFLEQELRKYPPTRLLADSLRDRHDHWWYLPRLLCTMEGTQVARSVGSRSDPTTGVLAWRTADGLEVDTVEVLEADEDHADLRALSGRALRGAGDPALLLRHDYSPPDLERRSERREAGCLVGSVLREIERDGELVLSDPPGLLERLRRYRALSKACRRELAQARGL